MANKVTDPAEVGDGWIEDLLVALLERASAGETVDVRQVVAADPRLAADSELAARLCARWRRALELLELRPRAAAPDVLPRVPRYRIEREIGRGGMGRVYAAEHTGTRRRVALKVLPPELAADEQRVRRFELEQTCTPEHPHIVQVFDAGPGEGCLYLAMHLVDGPSLDRVLDRLRSPDDPDSEVDALLEALFETADVRAVLADRRFMEWVAGLGRDLARALARAHDVQLLHRDVKPSNILLEADGTPRLADFGLAYSLDAPGQTRSGERPGTTSYMSPEQLEGRQLGRTTDVWSLGVTLYECLGLERPFGTGATRAIETRIRTADPVPLRRRNTRVPWDLATVVMKCLEKSPADRFQSAAALGDELDRVARGEPIVTKRASVPSRLLRRVKRHRRSALVVIVTLSLSLVLYVIVASLIKRSEQLRTIAASQDLLQEAIQHSLRGEKEIARDKLSIARARVGDALSGFALFKPQERTRLLAARIAMRQGAPADALRLLEGCEGPSSLRLRAEAQLLVDPPAGVGTLRSLAQRTGTAADRRLHRLAATLVTHSDLDVGGVFDGRTGSDHLGPNGERLAVGLDGSVALWSGRQPPRRIAGRIPIAGVPLAKREAPWFALLQTAAPDRARLHGLLFALDTLQEFHVDLHGALPALHLGTRLRVPAAADEPRTAHLRLLEVNADGKPVRVAVLFRAGGGSLVDRAADLETGRWTLLEDPGRGSASYGAIYVRSAGERRLVVARGPWLGMGIWPYRSGVANTWVAGTPTRLGDVHSIAACAPADPAQDTFLAGRGVTDWLSSQMRDRFPFDNGVYAFRLRADPLRVDPIRADLDVPQESNHLRVYVAGGVRLVRGHPPVHLALIRTDDWQELRVYDREPLPAKGHVLAGWRPLLRLRTQIPAYSLHAGDLDDDGDDEIWTSFLTEVPDRLRVLGLER